MSDIQGEAFTSDSEARKNIPLAEGLLWYFPNALAEVARLSKTGNDKHNPGQPLHWARGKSTDHADCIVRHLIESGMIDTDGIRHSAKVAWRALALLQEELERAYGLPLPRNALEPTPPAPDVRMVYVHDQGGAPVRVAKADTYDLRQQQQKATQQAAAELAMWRDEADGSRTNLSAYTSNGLPKPIDLDDIPF